MKGIRLYANTSSVFFNLHLLEELKEHELLELNEKYKTVEVNVSRCDCGRLYEPEDGLMCSMCEKIQDEYDPDEYDFDDCEDEMDEE